MNTNKDVANWGLCGKIRLRRSYRRNGSVCCNSLLCKERQLMMRNYIMVLGLRSVVEDSALEAHNTTSLGILFVAFRRKGLPLSSRIHKSAKKLRLTERDFFCGVFFGGVPPSSKIIVFYLLYEQRDSVISLVIRAPGFRFRALADAQNFYRLHNVQTGSGTTHLTSCNGYGASFVGLERPKPHVDD